MTDAQMKMIDLYDSSDEKKKQLIFDLLTCAAVGRDSFWNEMQELLDKKDIDGMKAAIAKWILIVNKKG